MIMDNPYLAVDRRYEEECDAQDAYAAWTEEFDYAALMAGCDEIGELALAIINNDGAELKKWKTWIETQVEQQYIARLERAKEDDAEAQYEAYISREDY